MLKRFWWENYYEIVALICAATIFSLVSWYVSLGEELNIIDETIRDFMYSFRGEKYGFWFYVFRFITEFGFFYIVVLIAALIGFKSKFDRRFWTLCGATILTYIANELIKLIFLRPRPLVALQWMAEYSTSYPSGHSMVSVVFYGFLIYFIYDSSYFKLKTKRILITTIVIIVLLIGLSRLVLGVHYFTDVIGGYALGIVLLMIFVMLYKQYIKKNITSK